MNKIAAFSIFLGALISFALEPLIGRTLLPHFGGSASVWVTCLAAFQVLLVLGYFYASKIKATGRSLIVHASLLLTAGCWLLAMSSLHDKLISLTATGTYLWASALIAVLLLSSIPFIIIGANSTLVQNLAGGAYHLYAVSNFGSLVGLLIYPLVLEPFVPIDIQWMLLGFATFAYLSLILLLMRKAQHRTSSSAAHDAQSANASDPEQKEFTWLWYLLPAATCFLLNATTAHMTSDVAPIPLLWAILLAGFLVSYIIGFSDRLSRYMHVLCIIGALSVLFAAFSMPKGGYTPGLFACNLLAVMLLVTAGSGGLHAWLYQLRPSKERLGAYYLAIAVGGAAGGILASIVAPLVTEAPLEYPIALVAAGALMIKAIAPRFAQYAKFKPLAIGIIVIAVGFQYKQMHRHTIAEGRSFYGCWRVAEDIGRTSRGEIHPCWSFVHGGTIHGVKSQESILKNEPTTYYGRQGGGLAFTTHPKHLAKQPIRAAIVGMGIGVMAYWGEAGDYIRFYEICPKIAELAKRGKPFDFIQNSRAKIDIVVGDARKALEQERKTNEPKWDLIIIDAYSGDSVPMHLITEEAFGLYKDRLTDDGILALHLSNWHMDLFPVARAAAKYLERDFCVVHGPAGLLTLDTDWAYIARQLPDFRNHPVVDPEAIPSLPLPRDDCGSTLQYILSRYLPQLIANQRP